MVVGRYGNQEVGEVIKKANDEKYSHIMFRR